MRKLAIEGIVVLGLITLTNMAQAQSAEIFSEEKAFQITLVEPVLVNQQSINHYFIDFGKDAFGKLLLKIDVQEPDTLIIHLGEKLAGTFYIDRNPGGSIRYQQVTLAVSPEKKEYVVHMPPDKRNTKPQAIALPDSFGVIMPFRYCEIENLRAPISTGSIRQKVYHYRFNDEESSFTCSDTILNKIWDLCKYSIKATSFCGTYVDGDRERIPYEADALINQLSHYSVDREYAIARRTNEYFMTNPTWPTEWLLQTPLLFYYDYMYTGNKESMAKYYDRLKTKTLIDLEREDGLICSKSEKVNGNYMKQLGFENPDQRFKDIVDWPAGERDGYEMADINTVVNAFHYASLRAMSKISGFLGKKEDSVFFSHKAEIVKTSINEKLLDTLRGIYIDGENSTHASLHANMFALAFGLVPQQYVKSVSSFVKTKGMACSVYGAQFLLEGLYMVNEPDYALELLTATNDRSWWNMIASGSTITMEAWDMKYKSNADWNHAWGAAPANIITRYLWGIIPKEPGFGMAQIQPRPGKLSFSSIKVPTIKGPVLAEYKRGKNNICRYSVIIPPGMKAEFVLSDEHDQFVKMNNKKVNGYDRSVFLHPGKSTILVYKNSQ